MATYPELPTTAQHNTKLLHDYMKQVYWPKLDEEQRRKFREYFPLLVFTPSTSCVSGHRLGKLARQQNAPDIVFILINAIWGQKVCRTTKWWRNYRPIAGMFPPERCPRLDLPTVKRVRNRGLEGAAQRNETAGESSLGSSSQPRTPANNTEVETSPDEEENEDPFDQAQQNQPSRAPAAIPPENDAQPNSGGFNTLSTVTMKLEALARQARLSVDVTNREQKKLNKDVDQRLADIYTGILEFKSSGDDLHTPQTWVKSEESGEVVDLD